MWMVLGVLLAALLQSVSSQDQLCPTLPGQLGQPQDLNTSSINLFIDLDSLPNVIENGDVTRLFVSLASISDPLVFGIVSVRLILANLTSIPLQLTTDSSVPLYYALSLFSRTEEVAPTACPMPQFGPLQTNTTLEIGFSCISEGIAYQQGCLTIGTEPFTSLNGTYRTFTFFFPIICTSESPSTPPCMLAPPPALVAEMCVTPNNSLALVHSGAGSWPLLTNVLSLDSPTTVDGYCFIDESAVPPGIVLLLRDDTVNILYAIPSIFDDLEVLVRTAGSFPSGLPLSYSVKPVSENTTVLDNPGNLIGSLSGVTYNGRVDFLFDLMCKNPGVSRIFVNFNVSGVIDGVIYSNTYPDLYFYRNCSFPSNGTVVVVLSQSSNLGVRVGIPLAVTFILLVGVAIVLVVVLLYFTRRHRRKTFEFEQERQLEFLASSNAYHLSTFESAMEDIRQLDMEYNYASLEVVGELGEGAFGRVFKACAPGLQQEDEEERKSNFVAVKTLKEETDSDNLAAFIAEVKTCAQFKHANVVRLVGVCTDSQNKCMIFEYMDLGSLNDILRKSDPANPTYSSGDDDMSRMTPEQFLSCCLQVAQGLTYLASLKFVHRDIATRNCLLDSNFVVKIADFGMSREVCTADYYRIGSAKAVLPVRWIPPEALLYGKFTVKSDVWSYGVLMWEVYSYAQQPYGGISNYEVIDRIKDGRVLDCPELCPASVYDIMKSCWTRVPQRRPPMSSILTRLGHLVRSNSMNALDDYTTMGPSEGYLNLSFGMVVQEEELQEKRRVDALVAAKQGRDEGDEIEEATQQQDSGGEENNMPASAKEEVGEESAQLGGGERDEVGREETAQLGGGERDEVGREEAQLGGDGREQLVTKLLAAENGQ